MYIYIKFEIRKENKDENKSSDNNYIKMTAIKFDTFRVFKNHYYYFIDSSWLVLGAREYKVFQRKILPGITLYVEVGTLGF